MTRRAGVVVLVGLGLPALALFYVMLVPPWGVSRPGPRPRLPPISAPDNAWTEYSGALADLRHEATPRWLGEAAASPELTPAYRP